jgi:hypothetical protein
MSQIAEKYRRAKIAQADAARRAGGILAGEGLFILFEDEERLEHLLAQPEGFQRTVFYVVSLAEGARLSRRGRR